MAADEGGVRYVDLSRPWLGRFSVMVLEPLVEAAARIVRDKIIEVMEASTPSGKRYPIPSTIAPRKRYNPETGQWEELPGKFYTASAPGEPPAVRTGGYRDAWLASGAFEARDGHGVMAVVYNSIYVGKGRVPLWDILQRGRKDGTLQSRPHIDKALELARPEIEALIRGFSGRGGL